MIHPHSIHTHDAQMWTDTERGLRSLGATCRPALGHGVQGRVCDDPEDRSIISFSIIDRLTHLPQLGRGVRVPVPSSFDAGQSSLPANSGVLRDNSARRRFFSTELIDHVLADVSDRSFAAWICPESNLSPPRTPTNPSTGEKGEWE